MDDQLTRLESLLNLVDTKSTMEEFLTAFGVVVDYVKQMKIDNEKERQDIEQLVHDSFYKAHSDLSGLHTKEASAMQERFRALAATIRDGVDGKDGPQGPVGPAGASIKGDKGVQGERGADGSPDTPDAIIDKVNQSTRIINKERVEGLTEFDRLQKLGAFNPAMGPSFADLENIKKLITTTVSNGTGGKFSINFVIDGGGSAITTGVKGFVDIPYPLTITGWQVFGDQTGSIVVDVWKAPYASFPPTVANAIAGSELPTLASQQVNENLALTTWTTGATIGDVLAFNVSSVSTVTRVTVSIIGIKN